jgi:hypothetical protein
MLKITNLFYAFILSFALLYQAPPAFAKETKASTVKEIAFQPLKKDTDLIMTFSTQLKTVEDFKKYPFLLKSLPIKDPVYNAGGFTLSDTTRFIYVSYVEKDGPDATCDTPGCPFAVFMDNGKGFARVMRIDLRQPLTVTTFRQDDEGTKILFCEAGGHRGQATWLLKNGQFVLQGIQMNVPGCMEEKE